MIKNRLGKFDQIIYVAGMGEMTFAGQRLDEVKYEMLGTSAGQTYSFPVFFIKEGRDWKILNF
ncbi:MAG: hypothetical protein ABIG61_07890 [Planctomycetota bacterium]